MIMAHSGPSPKGSIIKNKSKSPKRMKTAGAARQFNSKSRENY